MRFAWCVIGAVTLAALGLAAGCTSDSAETGAGGGTFVPGTDATLSFGVEGTLALTPGEVTSVVVTVEPAAHYEVTFHLVGAALDASLSPASVVTDSAGLGAVTLRAPNAATSFVLRAAVTEGPTEDLQVAVSDQGFGSLQIVPSYSGQRSTERWIAKVVSGTQCAALVDTLPEDPPGALTAEAEPGEPLVLDVAPVGPSLAVAVRGGHFMWGCADEANLVAGGVQEVQVPIVDEPIDTSEVSLDLDLEFLPDSEPWQLMVDAIGEQMLQTMLGSHEDEASALLAAMAVASGAPDEFDQAAVDQDWLPLVRGRVEASDATLARAVAELGGEALKTEPLFLAGTVESVPDVQGYALLELRTLLGVAPEQAGVPAEYLVNLSVDPADAVQLGGSVFWLASRVLGTTADQAAEQLTSPPSPDVTDVPSWVAASLPCSELASELGGFGECDEACMSDACTAALELLWNEAREISVVEGAIGQISMQASGAAVYDDYAKLTGFEGVWLGMVTDGEAQLEVTGEVTAEPSAGVRPR